MLVFFAVGQSENYDIFRLITIRQIDVEILGCPIPSDHCERYGSESVSRLQYKYPAGNPS